MGAPSAPTLEPHELATVFPLLEGQTLADLTADVRKHGLREEIVLLDGKILDGRNRYRACVDAAVEPRFINYLGDDPIGFVLSLNLHRRHLDEGQRAMVAARLASLKQGRPTDKPANLPVSIPTQPKAAEMLNVSERSVRSARAVIDRGTPELAHKVETGKIAVSAAAEVARLPAPTQATIVARVERLNVSPSAMRRAVREAVKEAVPVPERPSPAKAVEMAKRLSEEKGEPVMVVASDGQYHGYTSPEDQADITACDGPYTGLRALWEAGEDLPERLAALILRKRPYQRANIERALSFIHKFEEAWNARKDLQSAA